jgi:N-dimethylarginine dimethylaminohydrolase
MAADRRRYPRRVSDPATRGLVANQSMVAPLRRVLVRAPEATALAEWRACGWRAEPEPAEAEREHEAFRALLARLGAEVVLARPGAGRNADAVYVCDAGWTTKDGLVILRPGKANRREEGALLRRDAAELGVPVVGEIVAPGTVEGGDLLWLDEETLVVGRGYRTNDEGIRQLRELVDASLVVVDLPHWRGAGEVLHLMSLISPLDDDLAVVYAPLLPVRLVEALREREIALVEAPDDEYETMAVNVLAVAPRVAVAIDANPMTRDLLADAGVDVHVYRGDTISFKGDGGPTCLTRPLLRGDR